MSPLSKYCSILLLMLVSSVSHAQGLRVVQPIDGYVCMSLNLSERQLLDNSKPVPVRAEPSPNAPQIGVAGATVAVLQPAQPVNGFVQMLFPTGQHAWIPFNNLRPWRSVSNPAAKCVPSWLSNGKPGFDYK